MNTEERQAAARSWAAMRGRQYHDMPWSTAERCQYLDRAGVLDLAEAICVAADVSIATAISRPEQPLYPVLRLDHLRRIQAASRQCEPHGGGGPYVIPYPTGGTEAERRDWQETIRSLPWQTADSSDYEQWLRERTSH